MKKIYSCIIFLTSVFFIFSCSSTKQVLKPPPAKYIGTTLSKGLDRENGICVPRKATETFTTNDTEVVAIGTIENLSGKHSVRWDWHDPSGRLYYSSNQFQIEISDKKYVRKATPWHKLTIKNDKAMALPGSWKLKIYLDNELVETKSFVLDDFKDVLALGEDVTVKPFPKDWGLIIGIENYANLPSVNYAHKDALIMKNYFMKVFGIPEENIIFLIDSDATKSRLEGFIKQYIPSNVEKNSTLYVYFAGHGAPDITRGEPYLVPYDGDTRFLEQTGYQLKQFYADLDKLNIQRSYVFLDSCFSGVASRAAEMLTKGARPALLHVKDVKLKSNKIVSFSASSQGQISNAYNEKEHGLFTYYLAKGLSGEADLNRDNWVSVVEVFDYVDKNVTRVSRRIGSEQRPAISPSLSKLKDISISRALK